MSRVLPTLLKMVDMCNGQHPGHETEWATHGQLPFSSVNVLVRASKRLRSIVHLEIKMKSNATFTGMCLKFFENPYAARARGVGGGVEDTKWLHDDFLFFRESP